MAMATNAKKIMPANDNRFYMNAIVDHATGIEMSSILGHLSGMDASCREYFLSSLRCDIIFPRSSPMRDKFRLCVDEVDMIELRREYMKEYHFYRIDVDDVEVNLQISDSGKRKKLVSQRTVDFILECFAIDEPRSLKEIINIAIPKLSGKSNIRTPIILVGIKNELEQESNLQQSDLCSVELGQVVAHLVGAVKYVECSTRSSDAVHKVFEEGIRASYNRLNLWGLQNISLGPFGLFGENFISEFNFKIINKRVLTRQLIVSDAWRDVIDSIPLQKIARELPENVVDVISKSRNFPLENIWFYQQLELETLYLASQSRKYYNHTDERLKKSCTWWCIDENKHQTSQNINDLTDDLVSKKGPTSMRFIKQDCCAIEEFLLSCAPIKLQRLFIFCCTGTLSFRFLSALQEGLEWLVVVKTNVSLASLHFPGCIIYSLIHLVLSQCDADTTEVPLVIGTLENLTFLDVTGNAFTSFPLTLGGLHRLQSLHVDKDQMIFPPKTIMDKSAQSIVSFLDEFRGPMVKNTEGKLMIVGQEGVGKSTLVKSLRKRIRIFKTTPPDKTDGVEISVLKLNDTNCKVFDLAGDVEYLNTHSLFFSSNCLHLAVFNMSQISVSRDNRSKDQFCRLELWLQTIASQDTRSCAIIVGTHVDHNILSHEVRPTIRRILGEILGMHLEKHRSFHDYQSTFPYNKCYLCLHGKEPDYDVSNPHGLTVVSGNACGNDSKSSSIPHIIGYYEVSGVTNKRIGELKLGIEKSINDQKMYTISDNIPERWVMLRQDIRTKLLGDGELQNQPLLSISNVHDIAYKVGIASEKSVAAMLRFFHSQGDFLWYEDIPEMKDVVILDPKWLSDQLRSLISYRASVASINEGVLHHSKLPELWAHMTEENRSRLINLFRNVGLCFSISENEELFPCKLPIGWPDREMWSPFPKQNENQTSLLFLFSFVPPTFFPDLIVAINKKRDSFIPSVKPLYYRFNVVYTTQEQSVCSFHEQKCRSITEVENDSSNIQQVPSRHRVHVELMPYSNSLKFTIRGPNPCCMVPNIRSLIKDVKFRRYRAISLKERVICPECELKKVHNPSKIEFDEAHNREVYCSQGHQVGSLQDVLEGKLNPLNLGLAVLAQIGRIVGETHEIKLCPKLFVVLPINLDSLSLRERFVYSYLRDGYAVHLLCECPGEWHFLPFPGFRVGKPKEFFKKYGSRVCKLLRVISALDTPFKLASVVEPHCKAGVAVVNAAENARKELQGLLENYLHKYPHLKESLGSPNDDLKDLKSSRGLQRSELSRFIEVKTTGRNFGPLVCTFVDRSNKWLWLCEEHNQRYKIVERL